MPFFILFQGTDRREQIDLLVELESISNKHNLGPALQLKISFCIVAALFDYSMKVHEVQKVQYWLRLLTKAKEMLDLAKDNKDTIKVSIDCGSILNPISIINWSRGQQC